MQCRGILEVLKDSLEDRPQQQGWEMAEAEVRYKLIIDPSEDDSLVRLLFSFGVLQREETRMFMCSDFPGDSQLEKVTVSVYHVCTPTNLVPRLSCVPPGWRKENVRCLFMLICQFRISKNLVTFIKSYFVALILVSKSICSF